VSFVEFERFELPALLPVPGQRLAVLGEQVERHQRDADAGLRLQHPAAEQAEVGAA